MRRSLLCALLCATCFVFAGCESPLSPSKVAGTYVLDSVRGSPLPIVMLKNEWNTITLLADTLRLHSDRRGEEVLVQRIEYHDGSDESALTGTVQMTFSYHIRDKSIEITYPCPINANCIAPPHATGNLTAGGLELSSLHGDLVFHRIAP